MNKKLLGLIGVLVVIALGVFAIFFLNGDKEDLTKDEKTPTEEVEDTNEADENEVTDDEADERDEYEKLLDEAIGDERLTQEEMIEIGQELVTRYYVSIEITDIDALEDELSDIYSNEEIINDFLDYGIVEGISNTKVDFSDDAVLQVSKDEFEYSSYVVVDSEGTDMYSAYILAMIEKKNEGFKIRDINFSPLNDDLED